MRYLRVRSNSKLSFASQARTHRYNVTELAVVATPLIDYERLAPQLRVFTG